MVRMEDSDLITRARKGDPGAFRGLVDRHSRAVFRLAFRMTGNAQDAEDVVQETFLKAFRSLDRFEARSQVGSWLYRIAANAAFDLLRARSRHPADSLDAEDGPKDPVEEAPSPERLLLSAEVQAQMARAMKRLTPIERSAFVLRHCEGLSVEEIGSVLGSDQGATKSSIFRAVRKMREALQPLAGSRA